MNLDIKITTNNKCEVTIEDVSKYYNGSKVEKGEFKKSDTISINFLQHNKIKENVYREIIFSSKDKITIPVKFDGWFTIWKYVLPTKEWFTRELEKETGSALGYYSIVYFADDQTIYKYVNGDITAVPLEELIEINPDSTTISKTSQCYVSICYLKQCYINLCKQILDSQGFSQCFSKSNINSELIYRRDLVWMAINVIKYLTEREQLPEVERIIENLYRCNELCYSTTLIPSSNGCGCSKG